MVAIIGNISAELLISHKKDIHEHTFPIWSCNFIYIPT